MKGEPQGYRAFTVEKKEYISGLSKCKRHEKKVYHRHEMIKILSVGNQKV